MTSFKEIAHYHSLVVLAAGLATLLGLWGTGLFVLRLCRVLVPAPWTFVTSLLLGILVFSFCVQIVGMANLASFAALRTMWWTLIVGGLVVGLIQFIQRPQLLRPASPSSRWALALLAVAGLALATNLLIAAAPSTKIDELLYHMLLPSRIVSDGELRFYREPWHGAIWPQMIYQISAAPLHAIGLPDAMNVVSWGLSAAALWFAWRIIRERTESGIWAGVWSVSLGVGLYPAVWHVTGGPHAFGDLAMMTAIVAYCDREKLLRTMSAAQYGIMLSILLLSAAVSKVFLMPVSFAVLLITYAAIVHSTKETAGHIACAMALPWVMFICPIAIWTWAQSGSPFGPIHPWPFTSTVYADGWSQATFEYTKAANQGSVQNALLQTLLRYSPLIWLGVLGATACAKLSMKDRIALYGLFAMQCVLIIGALPWDARFLGGLHFGLLVAFAAYAKPEIRTRIENMVSFKPVVAILLLPWLGLQMYYGRQFVPVVMGLDSTTFYRRYVAFYDDYLKLDQLLPQDAVLLVQNLRLSAVYAPRPVFFDVQDVPEDKQVFLFALPETVERVKPLLHRFVVGDVLYRNDEAIIVSFRTPGRDSVRGTLEVVRLTRK